jgi:hypothetical protein
MAVVLVVVVDKLMAWAGLAAALVDMRVRGEIALTGVIARVQELLVTVLVAVVVGAQHINVARVLVVAVLGCSAKALVALGAHKIHQLRVLVGAVVLVEALVLLPRAI